MIDLISAAKTGNIEEIQTFLDNPLNNVVDEHGYTALMTATRAGRIDTVDFLLNHGADPNIQTRNGRTALHMACIRGHYPQHNGDVSLFASIVERLLRHPTIDTELRADFCFNGVPTETPLSAAFLSRDVQCAIKLIQHGAAVNNIDKCNSTALHRAMQNGKRNDDGPNISLIKEILKRPDLDIDAADEGGRTALMDLCSLPQTNSMVEALELLLNKGAKTNLSDCCGNTLLHKLCRQKAGETINTKAAIDALLQKDPSFIETMNEAGLTPLHEAIKFGATDCCLHLVEQKVVDINQKGRDFLMSTPLHVASKRYSTDSLLPVIKKLVERGADINAQDARGETPLHYACRISIRTPQKLELVHYLLGLEEISLHITNHQGLTPLMAAAEWGVRVNHLFQIIVHTPMILQCPPFQQPDNDSNNKRSHSVAFDRYDTESGGRHRGEKS